MKRTLPLCKDCKFCSDSRVVTVEDSEYHVLCNAGFCDLRNHWVDCLSARRCRSFVDPRGVFEAVVKLNDSQSQEYVMDLFPVINVKGNSIVSPELKKTCDGCANHLESKYNWIPKDGRLHLDCVSRCGVKGEEVDSFCAEECSLFKAKNLSTGDGRPVGLGRMETWEKL
jgi:hypothetical protein